VADQLEGRNPVIEALIRKRRRVLKIWLDRGAKPDDRVNKIVELAKAAKVTVELVDRHWLDQRTEGRVHNGVVAQAEELPHLTAAQLVDQIFMRPGVSPFLVFCDELAYEHNLGAILRSALGFGVDGLVLPTRRGAAVGPVVQRVAMGAAEVVPIVRESLFSAMKPVKDAGIKVVGADMNGTPLAKADLRGAIALVMGSEGDGMSAQLRNKCDEIVSVPLAGGLESLNVSVAAAVIMYEKRRQDGWFPAV
jgi:23S rRNA (guanosine2251-2'-O)-methyltransferase